MKLKINFLLKFFLCLLLVIFSGCDTGAHPFSIPYGTDTPEQSDEEEPSASEDISEETAVDDAALDTPEQPGEEESLPASEEVNAEPPAADPAVVIDQNPFYIPPGYVLVEKFDMDRFLQEKAAWEALNIQHYSYTHEEIDPVSRNPRVTITVSSGEAAEFSPHKEGDLIFGDSIAEVYAGIEEQIKKFQAAIESKTGKFLYTIRIDYDTDFHYPKYYHYGMSLRPEYWVGPPEYNGLDGGAWPLRISEFEVPAEPPAADPAVVIDQNPLYVPVEDFDLDRFLKEKAAWEALNIQHYSYTHEEGGPVSKNPRVSITVSPGEVPQFSPPKKGDLVFGDSLTEVYAGIEELINSFWTKVESEDNEYIYTIRIEYDDEFHYPAYIDYGMSMRPEYMVGPPEDNDLDGDSVLPLRISEFTALD
jgi:hypothetical protein